MKKLLLLIIPLLCATSCGSSGSEPDVQLTVSPTQLNVGPQGATDRVLTINSSVAWSAAINQGSDWIELSTKSAGPGQTDLYVKVSANISSKDRSGSIKFSAGSTKEQTVTVLQTKRPSVSVNETRYTIGIEGGLILVSGEGEFEVTLPDAITWIEKIATIEVGTVAELSVSANGTGRERLAQIVFRNKVSGEQKELILIQATNMAGGQLLNLTELIIDGIPAVIGEYEGRTEFFYPIDIDAQMKITRKVEFKGVEVDYIMFEGDSQTKVKSGDNYTFTAQGFHSADPAKRRIRISTHTRYLERTGAPRLNITGLPIVMITAPDGIVDEPKRPCTIKVVDPKGRTNENLYVFESEAGIEYRGSGAQRYPKKPYSITLENSQTGTNTEASLLGMRNDDKWILDAMWLDRARMRNRVCFDIWNSYNKPYYIAQEPKAQSGTHGHLVEVFLDGKYQGLFTLSDRLDRKQLQINKGGVGRTGSGYLFKTRGWANECTLSGFPSYTYNNNILDWAEVSIDYPDTPAPTGSNSMGYIDFKYYAELISFVASSSPSVFAEQFEQRIDMGNMVDYFIHINLIMAYDNIGRNMYWGIYDASQSSKMFPLVWDMDGTLGRAWNQDNPDNSASREDPNDMTIRESGRLHPSGFMIYNRHDGGTFRLFERIIDENPARIHAKIKARWNEVKNGALSPVNVNAIVDIYKRQQLDSGAHDRERTRWSNSPYSLGDLSAEVDYIKDWYQKRWNRMDQLINNLSND